MTYFSSIMKYLISIIIICGGMLIHENDVTLHHVIAEQWRKAAAASSKWIKFATPQQITCMAMNIFYEAGSENYDGKVAVGRVVLNRITHGFARTPCDVIYQQHTIDDGESSRKLCQFSWTCMEVSKPSRNNPIYVEAERIAWELLAHDKYRDVISKSTLFFHATSVQPNWPYSVDRIIGNHIFYSKYKNKQ